MLWTQTPPCCSFSYECWLSIAYNQLPPRARPLAEGSWLVFPGDSPYMMTSWCRATKACLSEGHPWRATPPPEFPPGQPRCCDNTVAIQPFPWPRPASTPARCNALENGPLNLLHISLGFRVCPPENLTWDARWPWHYRRVKEGRLSGKAFLLLRYIRMTPHCWVSLTTAPPARFSLPPCPAPRTPNSTQVPVRHFTEDISGSFEKFTFFTMMCL